jgi:hypothetical protein
MRPSARFLGTFVEHVQQKTREVGIRDFTSSLVIAHKVVERAGIKQSLLYLVHKPYP